jgi:hypothetical protein
MQNLPNQSLFRGFSANDWNQLEQLFQTQLFRIFNLLSLSTVFSNAEKMRKIESFYAILPHLSLEKTILSIGFILRFPFIQNCFTVTILVQVVS